LDIVASVLEAANSGSNKTRIMFTAKLSFKLLEKYLDLVARAGFVRLDNSVYSVTESGREFLRLYSDFRDRSVKAAALIETLGSEHTKLSRLLERPEPVRSFGSIEDSI
jgi:predicted transcriptional regulator